MEGYYEKEDRARKLLVKEKKVYSGSRNPLGEGNGMGFYCTACLFFLWHIKRAPVTGYLQLC